MTARQPRRARRRAVPASTLPRPVVGASAEPDEAAAAEENAAPTTSGRRSARRHIQRGREHHVTNDYSYVHKDLLTMVGVGAVVIAFIVVMSLFIA